jgi:hypothetical protein
MFDIFTVVKMWIVVIWVVTPCDLVGGYERFGGTYCFHLQGGSGGYTFRAIALMMEAGRTSETSADFYQTTRHNNPEDSHLYS